MPQTDSNRREFFDILAGISVSALMDLKGLHGR